MKTIIATILLTGLLASPGMFKADTAKSEFIIKGTSTVHDWESIIEDYSVKGNLGGGLITDLEVLVQSNTIQSGKSIMDDKTLDALQSDDFPIISFRAEKLQRADGKVKGTGTLTLVGKTKEIDFSADATEVAAGLQVYGEVDLIMSEFGIEPPKAMFGTLTTGDQVTISFNFFLN